MKGFPSFRCNADPHTPAALARIEATLAEILALLKGQAPELRDLLRRNAK